MEPFRLLLVEDDVDDQQAFLRYVRKANLPYETQVVSSVAEAKRVLRTEGFSAIITDHGLPDGTAFDVLKARNGTPVIVVTGNGADTLASRMMRVGAADYVIKDVAQNYLSLLPLVIDNAIARQRTEVALQESEKRYHNLVENANDAIVSFTIDGIVTSVNRCLERMLGWSRAELLGQHYRKLAPPATVTFGQELTRRFLAGEQVPSLFGAEFLSKDGRIIPVEGRTQVIRDQRGRLIGFQGIYRDISIRRALEQERAEFLAMLSHDIKTPLSVLIGYADLSLQALRAKEEHETAELVDKIREGARRVHTLITNCLKLTMLEEGHLPFTKELLSVTPILQRLQRQYEPEARGRDLCLSLHLCEDLPLVEGDPEALEYAFGNLLHNALRFTPTRGKVEIATGWIANQVVVSVTDTGPGVAADEIPFLFQQYQRANKSKGKGRNGFGLRVTKALVEAHGGRITIDSEVGGGSCFSVFLPIPLGWAASGAKGTDHSGECAGHETSQHRAS